MRVWPLALASWLSAALIGCGPGTLVPQVTEPPSSTGSAADIEGPVGLGAELAALRGQNLVALELDRRHESPEALMAVERAGEIMQIIENRAGGTAGSGFARLDRALEAAIDALERPDPAEDLDKALAEAGRATLDIESEVVGATAETAAYRASVVAALAGESARFYELAFAADPFDLSEYRAGYGSLREARNLHDGLTTVFEENLDDRARAAETVLASMFEALPESDPPTTLSPSDNVAAAAYMLGVLLADQYGALSPPPADRLGFIVPLLEELLTTYESGEAGVADVLLEQIRTNFCCPQTSAGTALEDELEALSEAIRSGAADEKVAALVEQATELAEVAAL